MSSSLTTLSRQATGHKPDEYGRKEVIYTTYAEIYREILKLINKEE